MIRTGEDFVDVTEALAVELAGQNVRYAEVTGGHRGRDLVRAARDEAEGRAEIEESSGS